MPDDDKKKENQNQPVRQYQASKEDDSSDDDEKDSDSDSESADKIRYVRPTGVTDIQDKNIRDILSILNSKRRRREQDEEVRKMLTYDEEQFNFPEDPERWREEDLMEYWGDGPIGSDKTGWDPNWVDRKDVDAVNMEIALGRKPSIGPFYIPYRKPYPVIPDDHPDISTPKSVIEELDRIEEFMRWVSYIFEDGSSYEGTVWDDKAHGKGVFVGDKGLVRYEGEWLHNEMEGHGVVEVDIPRVQPIPGSKLEQKMRRRGRIITRDFMSPEDREWLEMDIEDSVKFAAGRYEIPFYERKEWIKHFGRKPEKGRYRYAGQWKHGRMHGCGVYEVNERIKYGRFYFGEYVESGPWGCDVDICAMHAGIAEVAAAKARMFINKPDGMVREERGPYGDPQHPYFYEEEDLWMAPGFLSQFYEVPDKWKMYVHEVDQEREMWLNSFYKAPLRLAMPAELEYWWANESSKGGTPEFLLVNKEPEPDPEDPSKLIYTEDPLIMHTPTGRFIDYVDDEEQGIRLFWVPDVEELENEPPGEDADSDSIEFLPLLDEVYAQEAVVKEEKRKPIWYSKLEKWVEKTLKDVQTKKALLEKEKELAEAELTLQEAIVDLDDALRKMEKVEENKAEMGDASPSKPTDQFDKTTPEREENEEEEEEDEGDEDAASFSFGSVENQDKAKNDENGNKAGKSPFGASSLPFAACSLVSQVPSKLLHSFTMWKARHQPSSAATGPSNERLAPNSVNFPNAVAKNCRLSAAGHAHFEGKRVCRLPMIVQSKAKASQVIQKAEGESSLSILSWHSPLEAVLCL